MDITIEELNPLFTQSVLHKSKCERIHHEKDKTNMSSYNFEFQQATSTPTNGKIIDIKIKKAFGSKPFKNENEEENIFDDIVNKNHRHLISTNKKEKRKYA